MNNCWKKNLMLMDIFISALPIIRNRFVAAALINEFMSTYFFNVVSLLISRWWIYITWQMESRIVNVKQLARDVNGLWMMSSLPSLECLSLWTIFEGNGLWWIKGPLYSLNTSKEEHFEIGDILVSSANVLLQIIVKVAHLIVCVVIKRRRV